MATKMKQVTPVRTDEMTLTVKVDPLAVGRGHRTLPRGGVHGSGKQASRAKSRRQWRKELADGGRPSGRCCPSFGPLV